MVTVTYELEEKKKKILYNPEASDNKATTHIHERSIKGPQDAVHDEPNRSCSVHQTFFEATENRTKSVFEFELRIGDRPMTQEEVEKFEQDWINLWNPEEKGPQFYVFPKIEFGSLFN